MPNTSSCVKNEVNLSNCLNEQTESDGQIQMHTLTQFSMNESNELTEFTTFLFQTSLLLCHLIDCYVVGIYQSI